MTHYSRRRRYGDVNFLTPKGSEVPIGHRMAARYKVSATGCWEWTGDRRHGYGIVVHEKRRHYAHRLAWSLVNGPIPAGMYICHHCDNPPCINVEHLFLGTPKDNYDDMVAKDRDRRPGFYGNRPGRQKGTGLKSHCLRGHPLSGENVRVNKQGTRFCVACKAYHMKKYHERTRKKAQS